MSSDSVSKTIVVALGVCLVCSVFVSTAAVTLKSIQEKNKKEDMLKNILLIADLYKKGTDIGQTFKDNIQPVIIDLTTGDKLPKEQYNELLNTENFDITAVSKNKETSIRLPADKDQAKILRIPRYMIVYYIKEGETPKKIIMPLYGQGLWSTMYGFISLDYNDLSTVTGFSFYEHGETPGLGGEVDNPRWKSSWVGKAAFDDQRNLKITVIKGKVDPSREEAKYQIDGLSGATITTNGINNLVRFWLKKDYGYGKFLDRLIREKNHG